MIVNDRVLGKPLVDYTDTKANIEAMTGLVAGSSAYATDIQKSGVYITGASDGSYWLWRSDEAAVIKTGTYAMSISDRDVYITGSGGLVILPAAPYNRQVVEIISDTTANISGSFPIYDAYVQTIYQGEAFRLLFVGNNWRLI